LAADRGPSWLVARRWPALPPCPHAGGGALLCSASTPNKHGTDLLATPPCKLISLPGVLDVAGFPVLRGAAPPAPAEPNSPSLTRLSPLPGRCFLAGLCLDRAPASLWCVALAPRPSALLEAVQTLAALSKKKKTAGTSPPLRLRRAHHHMQKIQPQL